MVNATTLALFDYVYTPTIRLTAGYEGDNNHVFEQPTFNATEFAYHSSAATSDMQSKTEWKVFAADDPEAPLWSKTVTAEQVENGGGLVRFDEITIDAGVLEPSKNYFVACRYNGAALGWSKAGRFNIHTADQFANVTAPTITITGGPDKVDESPVISLSEFAISQPDLLDRHIASDYEIRQADNDALIWASYANQHDLLKCPVPADRLQTKTQYKVRARQRGRKFYYSQWSEITVTTAEQFATGVILKIWE